MAVAVEKENQTKFHQRVEESVLIDTQFIELQEPLKIYGEGSTRENFVYSRT